MKQRNLAASVHERLLYGAHRELAEKQDVRIYDYLDAGHPALSRMWKKRQHGYGAMGYTVKEKPQSDTDNGPGHSAG